MREDKLLKVLYISSKGNIHDYRFLSKLVQDYEVLFLHYAADEYIDEIKTIPGLKTISRKPKPLRSLPLLSEKNHFKKVYDDFKPDIVHTGYVWQVGILPVKFNIHPHLSMPWGSDVLTEPGKYFFLKNIVRKVMINCDKIQCDAEFVKQKIINDYNIIPQKIAVFPWGIDLKIFKPGDKLSCRKKLKLNTDKFTIIYNRSLEPVYGVSDLLEGFNIFSKNKDDVNLLMLSGGSLKNNVINFINRNNLDDKIDLIGRVANSDLPDYLNASDVYISTALSDGASLAMLEALACGLPVIVTDVPAIKEWISGSNGIVIPRKDPQKVSEALQKYYDNRELMKTHGSINAQIAKEKADWDLNYLKLKDLYSELLQGHNAK
jgi:glycosyltransferase involved in cell wall biosynthesis